MATRKSARLAGKDVGREEDRVLQRDGNRDEGRRASIGSVMGMTPAKPKGNKLREAKAVQLAEAAAARLDAIAEAAS